MAEYIVSTCCSVGFVGKDFASGFKREQVTRCRDCKWLGRESIVPGEYRCNRTERVTTLDDYCSKAVRRDAD